MDKHIGCEDEIIGLIGELAATRNTYPDLILKAIKRSDSQESERLTSLLKDYESKLLSGAPKDLSPAHSEAASALRDSTWYNTRMSIPADIAECKMRQADIKSYLSAFS